MRNKNNLQEDFALKKSMIEWQQKRNLMMTLMPQLAIQALISTKCLKIVDMETVNRKTNLGQKPTTNQLIV